MLCSSEQTGIFLARYLALKHLRRLRKLKEELGVISQANDLMITTPFNIFFVEDHFLKKAINSLFHINT